MRSLVIACVFLLQFQEFTFGENARKLCMTAFDLCFARCPGVVASTCLKDCGNQQDACFREADAQEKADKVYGECNALASKGPQLETAMRSTWNKRRIAINDGLILMRQVKEELERDKRWSVGDAGSLRELSIYIALITKTTTSLIENLGGMSTGKFVRSAKYVYDDIERGRTIHDIMTSDTENAATNVLWDAAAEVSPIIRGAKAIREFVGNINELMKTPADLDASRNVVRAQLTSLDAQIDKLQRKLDQINRDELAHLSSEIYKTYAVLQSNCMTKPGVSKP